MVSFFHSLQRQMLVLDKISETIRSTEFVHMQRFIQHKMKVRQSSFKRSFRSGTLRTFNMKFLSECFLCAEFLNHNHTGTQGD